MNTSRLFILALIIGVFASGPAGAEHDCSYYGECERGEYRGRFGGSDRGYYDDQRYEDYRREREEKQELYEERFRREQDAAARAAQKQAEKQSVKPSCPEGTTFNGKHCIQPEGQRRKGGKGTINPCPQGMHLSGGNCVR